MTDKGAIELDGIVQLPKGQEPDAFFDALVDFVEQRGGAYYGGYTAVSPEVTKSEAGV